MQYRPELDGLRAVAVTVVVLFHAKVEGPIPGGFLGVDLFFVLSGYLITSILAVEWTGSGAIDLKRFYWRRFLRLMPPLVLMLLAYLALAPLVWPAHNHGLDALLAALYLSDYSYAFFGLPDFIQHTWSLAVEEHYYLVWPLVLPFLLRSKRPLVWLALAWTVVTLWRTSHVPEFADFYRFDTRASGLILGSALYFMALRGSAAVAWAGLAALSAIWLTATFQSAVFAIPAAELGSAALIVGAASLPFLRWPPLVHIGKLSYGIYLWHFPIAVALVGMELPFLTIAAISFGLSTALAFISYVTVEAWARQLKGRPTRAALPI